MIFSAIGFPWSSLFTFSLFQLWRQNEPNVPTLPEILTEGHPVHHIFSRCLPRCTPSLKPHKHTNHTKVMNSEASQNVLLVQKRSEVV